MEAFNQSFKLFQEIQQDFDRGVGVAGRPAQGGCPVREFLGQGRGVTVRHGAEEKTVEKKIKKSDQDV